MQFNHCSNQLENDNIKESKQAKAKEDSYSGMRQQKLVTEAMFKPMGYDVHNVHISVYIGDWVYV